MKVAVFALFALSVAAVFANTASETETAQVGAKGDIGFSQSVEYAKARDGKSGGTWTQFEYGINDCTEILIEPFFYQFDSPDDGEKCKVSAIWKSPRPANSCWKMA